MSLSSSLYSGTSGLSNTSSALQVTSNNISNTNTVGFKKGTSTFADTLYQTMGTNAGASQVGLGVSIDNVSQVFTDGSLETTSNSTDLAIGGDGFFIVSEAGSDQTYYTRAGNFSFNESGALVTSQGYILQGWYVDEDGDATGAVTDLVLTEFTSAPDETEEMTVITNLDSDAESLSKVLANAFQYDEEDGSGIDSDAYEYQTVVTVYDSLGSAHELTVYYDKKSDTEWEYVITCDADEDSRSTVEDLDSAGLLARGSITFSESSGEIVSMTMEEYTGQIGNVASSGNNSEDDVHFEIADTAALQEDGYGISLTFDGDEWVLDESSLPEAYADAQIIYSDDQTIQIVLDPTSSGGSEEADIKISLDQIATSGDTLSFDVNDPDDCHVQTISNIANGLKNTDNETVGYSYEINDSSVMTTSIEGVNIVWNPYSETWSFSDPEAAAEDGTLIGDIETSDATSVNTDSSVVSVTNADVMTLVSDVGLRYNGTDWDWNDALKSSDITGESNTLDGDINPEVTIITAGDEGAIATTLDIELEWDGSSWSVVNDGGLNVSIVASESDENGVQISVYSSDPAGASTIEYSFGEDSLTNTSGQTISFSIDPTPPEEYSDAQIISTADNSVSIDFDGDSTSDVVINVTSGATTTLSGGETFTFEVDPDTPPSAYSDATITGDETYCSIDLDGSGNEDDKEDIVFTFDEDLGTNTANSVSTISFDIEGSTAWRTVTDENIEDSDGYCAFTVDFLGGDYGTTENLISFDIGTSFDNGNWANDSLSTTQYASSSSTTYQDADGYPSGDLEGVEVSSDGVVTGSYSNGQEIALFQIALADFNNPNGLESEGGNLYSATTDSGAAITNQPGENGLGTLSSYSLEMSNVDISEEFVSMIELQNAYEANAKIISTVDEMMSTVISMKR